MHVCLILFSKKLKAVWILAYTSSIKWNFRDIEMMQTLAARPI